jgi:hypothetical protein
MGRHTTILTPISRTREWTGTRVPRVLDGPRTLTLSSSPTPRPARSYPGGRYLLLQGLPKNVVQASINVAL